MGVKIFTFLLLIVSVWAYFVPIENVKKSVIDKDAPSVVFESPFMYTIDKNSINRVIQASYALRYKNRDEMINADIILKNIDNIQKFKTEQLKADLIVKKANDYTLTNNVVYTRDNFIKVNTDELFYNEVERIAKNTKPFDAIYYNHFTKGDTIYLDMNKNFITSKNSHFEIEINKKEKGKK